MPTVEWNQRQWGARYAWPESGEEWSAPWGGTESLWQNVIFPKITAFLPTDTIVEIALGFGRWTQFLAQYCKKLIAVDLSANCVENCRERFANLPHVRIEQNDGRSLSMVESGSVDLVFSFDSLVHVESDVIAAYLDELARILRPGGAAFIHHSNLANYRSLAELTKKLPEKVAGVGRRTSLLPRMCDRGQSVSAQWFSEACKDRGLHVVEQELVNWLNSPRFLIDSFSTIIREPSGKTKLIRNGRFMKQAEEIRAKRSA